MCETQGAFNLYPLTFNRPTFNRPTISVVIFSKIKMEKKKLELGRVGIGIGSSIASIFSKSASEKKMAKKMEVWKMILLK